MQSLGLGGALGLVVPALLLPVPAALRFGLDFAVTGCFVGIFSSWRST
jgi:hypothetical protein